MKKRVSPRRLAVSCAAAVLLLTLVLWTIWENTALMVSSFTISGSGSGYTILLSHRPELFETYAACGIDLVFSGHAHGGQFRLPFIDGLITPIRGCSRNMMPGCIRMAAQLWWSAAALGTASSRCASITARRLFWWSFLLLLAE